MPRAALPARYPPGPVWPAEMRADLTAAFLDYPDTKKLFAAVAAGEAPRPTSTRGSGKQREPLWCRSALESHVADRHRIVNDSPATSPKSVADDI